MADHEKHIEGTDYVQLPLEFPRLFGFWLGILSDLNLGGGSSSHLLVLFYIAFFACSILVEHGFECT